MTDRLATALAAAQETRQIVLGSDVLHRTGAVFSSLFGQGARAVVVADTVTDGVAGEQVREALRAAGVGCEESFVFPGSPTLYAEYGNVQRLRAHLARTEAIAVCVGAGTLNDITKLASSELGREYLVVGTAASMDGYAAFGASITRDGFKITHECPAPAGIVLDVPTVAAAPQRLTATGFGDLIEKLTGGADWIVADALGIEAIDPTVWALVQDPLREALADTAGLAAGEHGAIAKLSEGLVMSGLAMQAHQSSRPASGSGHHFSHLWEMEGFGMDAEPPLSHGLKVGLGTIASAALFEVALRRDLGALDVEAAVDAWPTWEQREAQVRSTLRGPMLEPALRQCRAKYVQPGDLRERLRLAQRRWPQLRRSLGEQLMSPRTVQASLAQVGAVSHPAQIGLDMARFRATYVRSNLIRARYTFSDLLMEAGLLDGCVQELFDPTGFWGAQAW